MNERPLISIISGYHNRQDWVDDTMHSLLAQTYDNIEIIVFDDCSTDNTYAKLKEIEQSDARIKITRNEKNLGFIESLINAINISKGEYIAIQGSGDISHPERIAKQAEILMTNPQVGLVGCLRGVSNKTDLNKLFEYKNNGWTEGEFFSGDGCEIILKRNLFAHGATMYRRSLYNEVGGYRKYFSFAQDRDLWIRMSEKQHFHIVPEVLYQRFFLPDAVSVFPEKLLLQRYLSEIAIQCAAYRRRGEKDIVDRYGTHAALFMRPSKRLSNDLSKTAIKWINQGDKKKAYVFAQAAYRQYRSVNSWFSYFRIKRLPLKLNITINKVFFFAYRLKKKAVKE
jgi:glycosyltransferase involved in cell wall biosynthesis